MTVPTNQMGERRPLATREKRWSKATAHWLARRQVSPNAVSVFGMIAGCLAGIVFWATQQVDEPWMIRGTFVAGAICVQLRLLANMLDGMVAIELNRTSPVGELYNEVPDRISDAATLIGFGAAVQSNLNLGFTAACVALLVAYIRAQGKAAGASHDFRGPMAKPHRMFIVTVGALYMAGAPANWPLALNATTWGMPAIVLLVVSIGGAITAWRRLCGIAGQLRQRIA